MPSNKMYKRLHLTGLTVLLSTLLVACGGETKVVEKEEVKKEVEVAETEKEEVVEAEPEILFEERAVELDYTKTPEEILANYTEKGMNDFKVNFPDTLSMNYALKHVGQKAPEVAGKTMDEKEVKLSDLKGKDVLINFNKTTCSVCKEMSPIIEGIAKDNKDLVVLNVFPVDSNKDIETYYKNLKKDVPANTLSLESNKHLKDLAVKDYKIEQVPTYVFVDKSGKISYTYIGNKDKIMFQDMVATAFGEVKLYDNVRTVTIRVDKDGNEVVEDKLVDEKKINEDGVDHTETNVKDKKDEKAKAKDEVAEKTDESKSEKKAAKKEPKEDKEDK